MKRLRGFTLIEILVTVAILAIVASLAYPSFIAAIQKSRRSEAFDAITRIQQAQERWRANHSSYTADLGSSGLHVPATTPNGYYTLTVELPATAASAASEYTIKATAAGPQAADTKCAFLSMKAIGGRLTYDSTSAQACWPK